MEDVTVSDQAAPNAAAATVDEVAMFVAELFALAGGEESQEAGRAAADACRANRIDGGSLVELDMDSIQNELEIRAYGTAHKLAGEFRAVQRSLERFKTAEPRSELL